MLWPLTFARCLRGRRRRVAGGVRQIKICSSTTWRVKVKGRRLDVCEATASNRAQPHRWLTVSRNALHDIALCCVGKFFLMLVWRCNGCVSMPSWWGMSPAFLPDISHITATELAHTSTHPQPCYISAISYLDPQQVRGQKLASTIRRIPSKCHKLYRARSTQRALDHDRLSRRSNGRPREYRNPASAFY